MTTFQDELEGEIGSVPCYLTCGSERVAKEAWACWNSEFGLWELERVLDEMYCHRCESAAKLNWTRQELPPNLRVRELNDRFRRDGLGNGSIMLTLGIQEKGGAFAVAAVVAVRAFDDFSSDNDPWGEHDFGAVEVEGEKVFFKIDYYDPSLSIGIEL